MCCSYTIFDITKHNLRRDCMCVADKFKCQTVYSHHFRLLESSEIYARQMKMERMKNLRFLCSNRKFWLRQERKLLSTTKYQCLHVWQLCISMATLEVFSIDKLTVYVETVALQRPFQVLILIDSHTVCLDSNVCIESLCD